MNKNSFNRKLMNRWLFILPILLLMCFAFCLTSFAQSVQQEEIMKSIQIINPYSAFSLRLWLDKTTEVVYSPGERIKIFFQVSQDAYVTLYNYDTVGGVKVIFPNQNSAPVLIKAGEVRTMDGIIENSAQPGTEFIQGFATTRSTYTTVLPKSNKDHKKFTSQFKGIIQPLPSKEWASSNLVSYNIIPITPPPPPPPIYGRISVSSNPQGAKVYLDNIYQGVTPLNLKNITLGQHSLRIIISGYQEWIGNISILSSQTTRVSADLISLQTYGSISISCDQSGAKIFLDGTYMKVTSANPVILEDIEDGYHELTVIKDNFRTWVSDIEVFFGEDSSVDVIMTEIF
jgi:hypothetical protein